MRRLNYAEAAPLIFFAAMVVLFSIAAPNIFLTSDNLTAIVNNAAILAIISSGLTLVLIVGEFDLTVAANASFSGALAAVLIAKLGWPVLPVVLLILMIGALIGFLNGLLVTKVEIPALIATIGVASILDGLTLWITDSSVIFSGFTDAFMWLGGWEVSRVQAPVFYLAVIVIWLAVMLKYTTIGRQLYAIGGSRKASLMAGIRVDRRIVTAFVGSSVLSAAAGLVYTARQGSLTPLFGSGFLLPTFAAAFLGSVTLANRNFHIFGTLIGVYLIETGTVGLLILGAPAYTQQLFAGVVLLLATGGAKIRSRAATHP